MTHTRIRPDALETTFSETSVSERTSVVMTVVRTRHRQWWNFFPGALAGFG
ncbi:Uncharacterised protein [Mycobacterium tuberculosis]|uniref:Uncharacterized protein n=1 Tax=Mycobacterium tuberculosis TaxID=1773 RepID=A0A654U196_MYCTX|nr:Uncharacterised protein [Mycobacterium tuberculosis]CKS01999.1 Uncharacterised protein [Mycobacterium tuberculosis]CNW80762.1 Uncharacterised protein [Mycobacterium tuberculosis]COY29159.1 Uncharacterised protein [Mycobacterium tuberculosis]